MPKDTKSLGNNKAPACESRGFVHKKRGVHFDTPPCFFTSVTFFRLLSSKMKECNASTNKKSIKEIQQ
mgnify:CR=1 FL=1